MNPIRDAAATTELGWVAGSMTGAFLFFFVAWAVWAYWPGNRERMEAASRLPFDDGVKS